MPKYFIEGEQIKTKRCCEIVEASSPEHAVKKFNDKYNSQNYCASTIDSEGGTNWSEIVGYCESCGIPLFNGTFGREYKLDTEDGIYLCCECYK